MLGRMAESKLQDLLHPPPWQQPHSECRLVTVLGLCSLLQCLQGPGIRWCSKVSLVSLSF